MGFIFFLIVVDTYFRICNSSVLNSSCIISNMTNVYSFDGVCVFGLLLICTCSYMRKIPKLKQWFLSEKKGLLGVCYKCAVIGTRCHIFVAISCVMAAFFVLFIK